MRTGEFTQEEITYLRSLRAVARVSNGRIRYTEEFKRECMRRYAAGESPARIFRDAGLDSALIGYKRIERCISRWRGIEAEADNTSPNKSGVNGVNGGNGTADGHHDQSDDDYDNEAFSPRLVVRSGRRDLRDLLIAQQVRRIAELEREVTELKAEVEVTIDHGDSAEDADGVVGAFGENGVVSEIGETTNRISRGGGFDGRSQSAFYRCRCVTGLATFRCRSLCIRRYASGVGRPRAQTVPVSVRRPKSVGSASAARYTAVSQSVLA
ncbi:hypothetical protein BTIS_0372 [Bifidobacterium tissieri]|uniref:Uncharacterized protein n=1 Tax=Bifidobacterium tissieri TaxID=1630162 RepID=A0A261FHL1_9BIFI|nr:HTH domain-containing protein [Bifidobacterium tissieri]OZG58651.1 hypothetical protein BTIS_0372 [Bifidobacterium tissieri]